ncbi:hypothetical protein ACETU7_05010 [Rhodococcus sp. 3Y1]
MDGFDAGRVNSVLLITPVRLTNPPRREPNCSARSPLRAIRRVRYRST